MIIGIVWHILFGKTILLSIVIPVHAFTGISGIYPSMEIGPELLKTPETEGMVFVYCRYFEMGDTFGDGLFYEKPVHMVCVDDFWGKYEVTQKEWISVMGSKI